MSFKISVTVTCDLCGTEITKAYETVHPGQVPNHTPAQWSSEFGRGSGKRLHGCEACMSIYREEMQRYRDKSREFFADHHAAWNEKTKEFHDANTMPVSPLANQ